MNNEESQFDYTQWSMYKISLLCLEILVARVLYLTFHILILRGFGSELKYSIYIHIVNKLFLTAALYWVRCIMEASTAKTSSLK